MYLKKRLETIFHNTIRKTGYDVVKNKYSKHELEIEHLIKAYQICTVLDVGANIGQYGKYLRIGGYQNNIISFEPIKEVFLKLEKLSSKDPQWDVYNIALGDFDGDSEINISENTVSSSVREMKSTQIEASPESAYVSKQKIVVRTLDSLIQELNIKRENIYMKIDTQGFEKNVLLGAANSLKFIDTLQLEMSTQPLYDGEDLYYQLSEFLYDSGYRLIKIIRGHTKPDGELLQFDGVFRRN